MLQATLMALMRVTTIVLKLVDCVPKIWQVACKRGAPGELFFLSCRISLLSSASFFFRVSVLSSILPRCPAHGAGELAACMVGVCVVFCLILCLCAGECACCSAVALRTQFTCSGSLFCRRYIAMSHVWTLSAPEQRKNQHACKLRNTGTTRKCRNRKILHHNNWDTATSMVVFAKIRRCEQTTPPHFSSFPTPAGRAEMVCPDRYFVKC